MEKIFMVVVELAKHIIYELPPVFFPSQRDIERGTQNKLQTVYFKTLFLMLVLQYDNEFLLFIHAAIRTEIFITISRPFSL
jgi:hypothetical protein